MSAEERMGIAVGLTVGLAIGLLFVALLFRKKVLDCTFDERQERARGVAFKYGFFTRTSYSVCGIFSLCE